ncbi:MAG: SAM-dependent methyltransferase [Lachnospiraceae bacterium]|nr:SAM-dependent methyltransferase [Lachnospiraceae bacterium]
MVKEQQVQLSKRLQMLADLVTPGNTVADVGCDHGFLSIYLIQSGISPRVIASDVRQGPLSAAKEHISDHGVEEYIETRLSDGLMEYWPGEADTLICAGMGGRLMQQILMQSEPVTREFREMILQPQSELMQFRVFLREQGYKIAQERIVCEEGKYYFAFRVVHITDADEENGGLTAYGNSSLESLNGSLNSGLNGRLGGFNGRLGGVDCRNQERRLYDRFGEQLLREQNPVLKEYLEKCLRTSETVQEEILAHRGAGGNFRLEQSLAENEADVEDIKAALNMFD